MIQTDGLLSREKLRDLRSLDSMKIRRRKGICLVEGEGPLGEALRTRNLLYLIASDERITNGKISAGEQGLADVPCYTLAHIHFRELTDVKAGIGLLGVARIPDQGDPNGLKDYPGGSSLLYLDGVQEPGNVGALIRTAWALGLTGVLLGKGTADPFSAKGIRASAGGVFHLPFYEGIGAPEMENLISAGFALFIADKSGQDYRSIKYPERSILALGNEGSGFSKWILQSGTTVGIPLAEGVDSLNVVVAGGIIAAQMVAAPGRGDAETRLR